MKLLSSQKNIYIYIYVCIYIYIDIEKVLNFTGKNDFIIFNGLKIKKSKF
jgi:hypothetical protein